MRNFLGEFFRALLELIGPVASVMLGIWLIAAFWHDYQFVAWLPIPFTSITLDPQGVRDLLIILYMATQVLLVLSLYVGRFRNGQTQGRNALELLFSLFPLGVLIVSLGAKQLGNLENWRQSDSNLMVLSFIAVLLDILLTVATWNRPPRPAPTS